MINSWTKINQFQYNFESLLLPTVLSFCVPLVWSRFQVLVHHKLLKVINNHVARRAKQPAIVHMKCTFRIISCPVIRSNIYREMRSCFRFRRSTRRFHNKLIHGVFCLALNERSYILQATIELFLRRYLRRKLAGLNNISREYINNCKWSINTNDCLFFANKQSLLLRTSTRSLMYKTTHRMPVWLIERSRTILVISNVFWEVNHLKTTLKLS